MPILHPKKHEAKPTGVTVWMYYETDGDAGYYAIELFSTAEKAEAWRKKKDSGYGGVRPYVVDEECA